MFLGPATAIVAEHCRRRRIKRGARGVSVDVGIVRVSTTVPISVNARTGRQRTSKNVFPSPLCKLRQDALLHMCHIRGLCLRIRTLRAQISHHPLALWQERHPGWWEYSGHHLPTLLECLQDRLQDSPIQHRLQGPCFQQQCKEAGCRLECALSTQVNKESLRQSWRMRTHSLLRSRRTCRRKRTAHLPRHSPLGCTGG